MESARLLAKNRQWRRVEALVGVQASLQSASLRCSRIVFDRPGKDPAMTDQPLGRPASGVEADGGHVRHGRSVALTAGMW